MRRRTRPRAEPGGRMAALLPRRIVWLTLAGSALLGGCAPLTMLDLLTPAEAQVAARDAAYGEHPRQRLDLYVPARHGGARPVVVFFYGGGWRSGDKGPYRFVAETLTREGFVVAIPDYRLVPEVRFPAFVEDSAAAVAWVANNVARYGGDPRRLFLIGHSAGAYNAAMVALDRRYLAAHGMMGARIAGVVGIAGPYDFLPLDGRLVRVAFAAAADPDATQPVAFARADAPPLLLINGSADTLVSPRNAVSLAERVRAQGGRARAVIYDGKGHVDIMAGLARVLGGGGPLLADITAFLADPTE